MIDIFIKEDIKEQGDTQSFHWSDPWKILYIVIQHEFLFKSRFFKFSYILQEVFKTYFFIIELRLQKINGLLTGFQTCIQI